MLKMQQINQHRLYMHLTAHPWKEDDPKEVQKPSMDTKQKVATKNLNLMENKEQQLFQSVSHCVVRLLV